MAEEIYQQSLEIELGLRNIPFLSKAVIDVAFKGRELATKKQVGYLINFGLANELEWKRFVVTAKNGEH